MKPQADLFVGLDNECLLVEQPVCKALHLCLTACTRITQMLADFSLPFQAVAVTRCLTLCSTHTVIAFEQQTETKAKPAQPAFPRVCTPTCQTLIKLTLSTGALERLEAEVEPAQEASSSGQQQGGTGILGAIQGAIKAAQSAVESRQAAAFGNAAVGRVSPC